MQTDDLLREGIAAFQAGDRETAHDLLSELVKLEPENEQAWYYLAASERDPAVRREYLERVLTINPDNRKAREVLDRIKAREAETTPAATSFEAPRPETTTSSGKSKIRELRQPAPGEARTAGKGIKLPFTIPGAPEYVDVEAAARDAWDLLKSGAQAIYRRPGVYAGEVAQATWWRFWLVSAAGAVIAAAVALFIALFLAIRLPGLLNIFLILFTPILAIPVLMGGMFVAAYGSHKLAERYGSGQPLVKHAMAGALVLAPLTAAYALINFVLLLVGIGSGLMILVIAAYGILTIADGYDNLHLFSDQSHKWVTSAAMVIGYILAVTLLSLLIAPLTLRGAIPFVLF